MENCLAAAAAGKPALADNHASCGASFFVPELGGFQAGETIGKIGEDFGSYFAANSVRAQKARYRDAVGSRRLFGRHYSRISSVKRFFNFIPAAPSRVRMDLAVRPCRPITFPRSSGWTRNSSTVTCSPSTAFTATFSG